MVTIDTWAVVMATLFGPVAAVLITRWGDNRREQRNRLLYIYRVLMATRRTNIAEEHVAAINLVEVEFHKVKPVIEAWSAYISHLNGRVGIDEPAELHKRWNERRSELLAILLSKIASHLGISKGEIEIMHGGYAPQGWADKEDRITKMQEYVLRLANGQAIVPTAVTVPPAPNNPFPPAPA